jgi:alpha-tubulin suppressor-like RCC1 family protein
MRRPIGLCPLPLALGLAAFVFVISAPACRNTTTEIVLVIDTNLTIPVDVGHVDISVSGSQMQHPTIPVDLLAAGAPAFPLTLGLTPAGTAGSVTVTVVGSLRDRPVVQQEAETSFVEGSKRMLRMLLLGSCMGTSCPMGETCGADGCSSAATPGASLPPWTGKPPARPVPAETKPLNGKTVWANGWHSCANEGKMLYCWGQNSDGQIGNGTTQNANARRPVMNVQDPGAVGLGQFISCICERTGQAWCWGRNVEAELGTGSTSMTMPVPTRVPGVTDCLQIGGGAQHTCVIHQDHTVSCWGANGSGQAGQPAAGIATVTSPMAVAGLANVVDIQGGEKYTCVHKSDMTVECWGDNSRRQLGDDTMTSRSTPAPVAGLGADIVEISVGRFFACARHSSGLVSCWGGNGNGQLGDGGTTDSGVALDIPAVPDATQLATGFQHACALRRSGVLSCWGANTFGQLGDGTTTSSSTPVNVVDITQVTSIAAGSVHTCTRHAHGLACWGQNIVNQIGDGTTTDRSRPVSVAGFL